jgi:diguanylate cyclase (GGDEF)-like protein
MLGFGKSKGTPPSSPARPPSRPASGAPEEVADDALDTLGFVLRALGRSAFAVDDLAASAVASRFEAWASHLVVRAPHPEAPESSREPVTRVDFGGARRFVATHRKREQAYVTGTVEGLRDAVWSFARTLHRVLGEDRRASAEVDVRARRLREAAQRPSAEELRREVLAAAESLEGLVADLRKRQDGHTAELGAKVRSLTEQLAETQREVGLDALTKLANRRALDTQLERVGELADVLHTRASLLMIDLDHFKRVNDTFGHTVGDDVLRAVADALARTFLRKSDFVARYGGEEFVVLLRETALTSATMLAERFRATLRTVAISHGAERITVTTSIGVAEIAPGEAPNEWLARADRALYEAKAAGRDRVVAAK